jgi:hypothetical protein
LRGVAGAGKTTALKEFHAGVDAAGKSHVLLAWSIDMLRGAHLCYWHLE